jgi:hypothetical protein
MTQTRAAPAHQRPEPAFLEKIPEIRVQLTRFASFSAAELKEKGLVKV